MKSALKKMGSASRLRLPSGKSRSGTMDDVGASPSGVTFQVGSGLVGGVELGGDPATNEERIALLQRQLRDEQQRRQEEERRREEVERLLMSSSPSQEIRQKLPAEKLPADATSGEALAWLRGACPAQGVTVDAFKLLLLSLRDNPAYARLRLPDNNEQLLEYAARMHMLGDIDRDDLLSDREFDRLWDWLPQSNSRAIRVSEGGTEHGVLGDKFGAKFVAPVDKFVFGGRAEWELGLLTKLERGDLIKRSIEAECTSHGNELKEEYRYICQAAREAQHYVSR